MASGRPQSDETDAGHDRLDQGEMRMKELAPLYVSVLLDRSGSMAAIADDVVAGYEEFVDRQRREGGDVWLTLIQFDSAEPFRRTFRTVHVSRAPRLTRDDYVPRGGTPLLDAVGQLIHDVDRRAELNGGPADQLVVIITDGYENASQRFTRGEIQRLIADRESRGWAFLFLAAGIDAFAEGGRLGVSAPNRRSYEHSPEGMRRMWEEHGRSVVEYERMTRDERMASRHRVAELADDPDHRHR